MSYTKKTLTFKSTNGEQDISYTVYTPKAPAMAIIQIIHDCCDYFERYQAFAEFLCEKGIIVCGCDNLGHGDSVKSADDYGFFSHENGHKQLVDDVELLRATMRKRFRALPYFMLGHGVGSLILGSYIVTYKNTIDGAIISGALCEIKNLKAVKILASLICRFKGERYRSSMLKNMFTNGYNERFRTENSPVSYLSADADVRDSYINDEKCNFTITSRAYCDIIALSEEISDENWASTVPRGLPVLILNALNDPVGAYGNSSQLMADKLQDCEIYELSMRNYPDMRHDILNDKGHELVYNDIFEWLMRIREGYLEDRLGLPVYFGAEEYR